MRGPNKSIELKKETLNAIEILDLLSADWDASYGAASELPLAVWYKIMFIDV